MGMLNRSCAESIVVFDGHVGHIPPLIISNTIGGVFGYACAITAFWTLPQGVTPGGDTSATQIQPTWHGARTRVPLFSSEADAYPARGLRNRAPTQV